MNDPKKYLSILGVLTIVCFALALMLGATFKSPAAVLQGLLTHDFDIWQYRMPRAILAVLVGAALALSGTIIQGIIHNPLASPDILSINHGASLAAVATLMMMPGTPVWALPVAACVGAAVAYLVLMLVAGRQAGPLQMALIGVALSAFYAAMTDYLMLSHPLEVNTAMVWLTGSLWGRTWSFVEMGAPLLILLLPLALLYSKSFDLLTLGEAKAATLGVNVSRDRFLLLGLAVLLAAVAVAIAGPIAFLGLVAPHLARKLVGLINSKCKRGCSCL